jgi:excisionase family DNA binding protein
MDEQGDLWMTRDEVAARLRVPPMTLREWAHKRRGPRYAKIGKHARYLLSDVVAWEKEQLGVS